jgi:hypothetical protein
LVGRFRIASDAAFWCCRRCTANHSLPV